MSLNFLTAPPKRLLAGITSASTEFYVTNILSFDGENDITPADLGTQHYCAFRNDTGTILELMEIDPSSISTGPITIVRRGLAFNGDLTTEDPDKKLDWPSGSVVQFGTDVPQIFQWLKEYVDNALIAGTVPASTTAGGIVAEASLAEIQAGTATKVVTNGTFKLFAPLDKLLTWITSFIASESAYGFVEEATDAEVTAGTATGSTGAKLFVSPAKFATAVMPSFGDGSDGNITISTPTTLTRDMYYDNLVVNDVLTTSQFRVFVKGTISGTGTIKTADGGNGGNGGTGGGVGAGDPGSAGTISPAGYFQCKGAGAGSVNGTNADCLALLSGKAGGTGGGAANPTTGGTATYSTKFGVVSWQTLSGVVFNLSTGAPIIGFPSASSGGGGVGATLTGYGGGGGGAGATGGVVYICAKTWTGTFTIMSKGGNGGNGGDGYTGGSGAGGGGGGGGGNGGISIVIYETKTWTGSYTLTGGIAGSGGAGGLASGVAGSSGTAGGTGVSYEVKLSNLL